MLMRRTHALTFVALMTITLGAYLSAVGQILSKNDRDAGRIMLRNVKDSIKKNYYDPEFHGVNLDEIFKTAEEKINEATSNGQVFGIIEKVMMLLLPTGADLREQEDPVLSYAASLAGVKLSPKEAGALFPIRWKLKP